MADNTIVRCAIHPAIGIARVGNAPDEYFIGPEVPGLAPAPNGGFKDAQGRIKRQAARFRIYGLNAANQVVEELSPDQADITWTVHLANTKAAWYQFQLALDIPEAKDPQLPSSMATRRRNAGVHGNQRRGLVIDPGPRSIRGKNVQGPQYHFDTGTFLGHKVPLGELRTGASGNLLVLGGFGKAGTFQANNPPNSITNNDSWYDDTADGPVTARVLMGGQILSTDPAWVIVGPPNYAPGITPLVTLYDIAYQAYLDAHPAERRPVSFTRDIYPILQRFDQLQWVNEGFFQGYGWQGQVALLAPDRLAALSRNDASSAAARHDIFVRFRDPSFSVMQEDAWPRLYGDSFNQPPQRPRQYLAVTREQYRCLSEWSKGNFAADWSQSTARSQSFDALPVQERPHALDRAALEPCSGGPFHPGEEATWPMRHASMYMDLCRLRHRSHNDPPEPDYGDVLTPNRALGADGPLHCSSPGDITRWMAVPWQTDTANCGSAYPNSTLHTPPLPDLPSFWPALVPNHVLTQQAYEAIMNQGLNQAAREAAFKQRVAWAGHLPEAYRDRNARIISDWYRLGIITHQPGPGDAAFPAELHVEAENGFTAQPTAEAPAVPQLRPLGGRAENDEERAKMPSAPLLMNRRDHL